VGVAVATALSLAACSSSSSSSSSAPSSTPASSSAAAAALSGTILQLFNHGLSAAALFLCVGILYERTHTRSLFDHGGLAAPAPRYALVLMLTALSSIGLPGLNGFPGELLVLMGAWQAGWGLAAGAGLGLILGAVYMLGMVRRVLFGRPADPRRPAPADLGPREFALFVPILVFFFVIGIRPGLMVDRMDAAATHWVASVRAAMAPAAGQGPAAPGGSGRVGEREY
jgi:NADH-quinone oxidoreductase subunit M